VNLPHRATSVIIAIWRRDAEQQLEFWVPLQGYMAVLGLLTSRHSPAESARKRLKKLFGLDPRCNARSLWTEQHCVVAFSLTQAEADQLKDQGVWLPVSMIDPAARRHLLQVFHRL
jgi:hypothetical protein